MCLCDIERMDRVCVDEGSIRCVDVFKLRLHLSIWVKVQKRFLASVSVRRSDRSTGSECLYVPDPLCPPALAFHRQER